MEKISHSITVLADTVERNKGIVDAVLTNFFTEDLYHNFVPEEFQNTLTNLSNEEILELPLRDDILKLPRQNDLYIDYPFCRAMEIEQREESFQKRKITNVNGVEGSSIICDEDRLCEVCLNSRSSGETDSPESTRKRVNTFVGIKKEHEIKQMVTVIIDLCSRLGVRNVVDIGSGRGILGHTLSKDYCIQVLGIESSDVSIHGGAKRIVKVNKQGRKCQHPSKSACHVKCESVQQYEEEISDSVTSFKKELTSVGYSVGNQQTSERNSNCYACKTLQAADCNRTTKRIRSTNNIDTQEISVDMNSTCKGSFKSLLYEVKSDSESIAELIKLIANHEKFRSEGYLLVALHACGDLTPCIITLFHTDPNAVGLCLVGCCYNLLTDSTFASDRLILAGFPMSTILRKRKFSISRAGKHLACQCPIKMAQEGRIPEKSLLYRAIFQVILRDLNWSTSDSEFFPKLRRMYKKHNDFVSYIRICYLKLTGTNIEMKDSEILSYYERYETKWQELLVYNQVHSSLGPVLEVLILLDRLAYLHELGYKSSEVIQLFCPLKSPRCFALVTNKQL